MKHEGREKKSETNKDIVFVISAGRTGTQFLGDRLSSVIGESFSVHEPDVLTFSNRRIKARIRAFGLWNLTFGKVLGRSGARAIGQYLATGRIKRAEALARIKNARLTYYDSIAEPLIIESNCQCHFICDELADLWPCARTIIIARDPRTWIQSWLNKKIRWSWYDPVRLLPPGRLTPHDVGDFEWSERWSSFSKFERLAWEWKFIYDRLLRHRDINPNARIFRYEDLFSAGSDQAMAELLNFASNHPSHKYEFSIPDNFISNVDNASKATTPPWEEWLPKDAAVVDALCGDLMSDLGYGEEPIWREKLKSNRCRAGDTNSS